MTSILVVILSIFNLTILLMSGDLQTRRGLVFFVWSTKKHRDKSKGIKYFYLILRVTGPFARRSIRPMAVRPD